MPGWGAPPEFPRRWILPLLLVLAVGFLLGLRPLADNNLDFHLNGGRWMLEHRAVPHEDPFTYGAQGRPDIDQRWLFQVVLYSLFRLVGYAGLSVVNALLALALLWLLALRMRRLGAGPAAATWVLLASAVAMHQRFLMRPENVSFIYLALLGLVLDGYLRNVPQSGAQPLPWRTAAKQLWSLPLIHLLWVNTEGLFVLGWALLGAYWVSSSLRRRGPDPALGVAAVASGLLCMANPYGLKGALYPFQLFGHFQSGDIARRHVGEIQPFWSVAGLPEDWIFVTLVVAFVFTGAASWRKRQPHEVILAVIFVFLALIGVRNVPLFVIVNGPLLAAWATGFARRIPPARLSPAFSRLGAPLAVAVAVAVLLRMFTGAFYRVPGLPENSVGAGLDTAVRPVAAAEFLRVNRLDGRILNSSNVGGWLEWALRRPVFIDMRLDTMGDDLFRTEVESWEDGGLERLIRRWQPDLVVFDHGGGAAGWIGQLHGRADWRLIHLDGYAAVYARRGFAPAWPALDVRTLPARWSFALATDAAAREILERPVPGSALRWLAGFVTRSLPPAPWLALARYCEKAGASAAAEIFYLEANARDPERSAEALPDLAAIYGSSGRPGLALASYARYLKYVPESPEGHNGMGMSKVMLGDLSGAERDFSRAIELDPAFEQALLNRGLLRLELNSPRGAADDFARALRLNPSSDQAREGLQASYRRLR